MVTDLMTLYTELSVLRRWVGGGIEGSTGVKTLRLSGGCEVGTLHV